MVKTLYDKLSGYDRGFNSILIDVESDLENINTERNAKKYDFDSLKHEYDLLSKEIDSVSKKTYTSIMRKYEKNPVFHDAIKGKISINETLEELSKVNYGIRKLLPRRKNPVHNARLDQLSELIDKHYGLRCQGILYPDNFVTTFAEILGAGLVLSNMIATGHFVDVNTDNARSVYLLRTIMPLSIGAILGTVAGIATSEGRFQSPEKFSNQAKFIDEKINQFY
ncbi:MAG TPA: hypothetical protein VEC16_00485 [Alphaproteobacteria bacterium]|nr:hypothetical protein [Alphaproteobacteria bacterium]